VAGVRWGHVFPLPLVAIVALLVLLILLTPNLLPTSSPSAGSLATQAELIVDRSDTSNVTHFYVQGLGEVRYEMITAQLSENLTWPPPGSYTNLTWENGTNWTGVLEASFESTADPVAVNVTATYVDATGATVEYYGVFAFEVANGALSLVPIAVGLSGYANLAATPLASLPLSILLTATSPGGAP
jgi:hypothetical protein